MMAINMSKRCTGESWLLKLNGRIAYRFMGFPLTCLYVKVLSEADNNVVHNAVVASEVLCVQRGIELFPMLN